MLCKADTFELVAHESEDPSRNLKGLDLELCSRLTISCFKVDELQEMVTVSSDKRLDESFLRKSAKDIELMPEIDDADFLDSRLNLNQKVLCSSYTGYLSAEILNQLVNQMERSICVFISQLRSEHLKDGQRSKIVKALCGTLKSLFKAFQKITYRGLVRNLRLLDKHFTSDIIPPLECDLLTLKDNDCCDLELLWLLINSSNIPLELSTSTGILFFSRIKIYGLSENALSYVLRITSSSSLTTAVIIKSLLTHLLDTELIIKLCKKR
jgi:hypothetical protein